MKERSVRFCVAMVAVLVLQAGQGLAGSATLPAARWDHRPEATVWTQATLQAIKTHGQALVKALPRDIAVFCPGFADADLEGRAAFWTGLFSALAKHESTWNPRARGAGGKYQGLLQIAPATARAYGCKADMLYDGAANLQCAVRIAARQVASSRLVAGGPGRWGGIAADWGPMRNHAKRAEIAAWTRAQSYCQPATASSAVPRLVGIEKPSR